MVKIEEKLSEKSRGKVTRYDKKLKISATIIVLINCAATIFFFLDVFTDPNVDIASRVLPLISGFDSQYYSFMLQFIFLDISLHICMLLEQIEDELEEMKFIRDEKRVREVLGGVSQFHNEIQVIAEELIKCFGDVLKVLTVLTIFLNAQAAAFMIKSRWIVFILFLPFMVIEIWMYCFGAQKIITKDCYQFYCIPSNNSRGHLMTFNIHPLSTL
jgi:hypothetical protein